MNVSNPTQIFAFTHLYNAKMLGFFFNECQHLANFGLF